MSVPAETETSLVPVTWPCRCARAAFTVVPEAVAVSLECRSGAFLVCPGALWLVARISSGPVSMESRVVAVAMMAAFVVVTAVIAVSHAMPFGCVAMMERPPLVPAVPPVMVPAVAATVGYVNVGTAEIEKVAAWIP